MALRNYITDNDLKLFYPNLAKDIWTTQTSYQYQIDKAFDILMDDLHNMNIRPERSIIPLDLKNTGADKNIPPMITTETGIVTGSAFQSNYERRVIMEIGSCTGNWTFYIDGNYEQTTPASNANSWSNGGKLAITSSYANSTVTTVIDTTYDWLRYRIEPTTGTSITYSVYMMSDIFSDCIIHGAFSLIFRSFIKEVGDIWDVRLKMANDDYTKTLNSAKFAYDSNYSGQTDSGEQNAKAWDITFIR
jgi:hypothetical protein